jgi:hypothetical protein
LQVGRLPFALELLRFGVTCTVSVIRSQPCSEEPGFARNPANAYAEVGRREVAAVDPCAAPWPRGSWRWMIGQCIRKTFALDEAVTLVQRGEG